MGAVSADYAFGDGLVVFVVGLCDFVSGGVRGFYESVESVIAVRGFAFAWVNGFDGISDSVVDRVGCN